MKQQNRHKMLLVWQVFSCLILITIVSSTIVQITRIKLSEISDAFGQLSPSDLLRNRNREIIFWLSEFD